MRRVFAFDAWGLSRALILGGAFALGATSLGCSVGEGEGQVSSDRLFVESCWNGSYQLNPSFFAANPYRDMQLIRVQRGADIEEMSDGLMVSVNNVEGIRQGMLGVPLQVGLPVGVEPIGVPERPLASPLVSLTLYLHQTCHAQNRALYAVDGTITFKELFSGNPHERSGEDRLTEAEFEATFVDPRKALPDGTYPVGMTSTVRGWFRFFYQRGQPAQPFP